MGSRRSLRFLRDLWRYRRTVQEHHEAWLTSVATAIRSAVEVHAAGRVGLQLYRLVVRLLASITIALVLLAVVVVVAAQNSAAALVALIIVVVALVVGWQWFTLGRPIRWLDDHADPTRAIPAAELPAEFRRLAGEARQLTDLPSHFGRGLDALAVEAAAAPEAQVVSSGD